MKFLPSRLIITAALMAPVSLWANSVYTNEMLSLNPLGYWKFDGNLTDTGQGNSGVDANPSSPVNFTSTGAGAPIDPLGQAAVLNSSRSQSVSVAAGNVAGRRPGPFNVTTIGIAMESSDPSDVSDPRSAPRLGLNH